jgi:hypothetical protein
MSMVANKIDKFEKYYQWVEFQAEEIILNNGVKLSQNLKLIDESNNSIQLSDVLDLPKLIIRYSALACDICLDIELKQLSKYIKKTNIDCILILTSDYNVRSLKVMEKSLPFSLKIYRIEEMNIPYEQKNNGLFVFMLDKELTVKDFFVPEKTLPELSNIYYRTLDDKYKIFHTKE